MNLHLLPVRSPFDESWICWCGEYFTNEAAALECMHPDRRARHLRIKAGLPGAGKYSAVERRRAGIGGIIALTVWVMLLAGMLLFAAGTEPPAAPPPTPIDTTRP